MPDYADQLNEQQRQAVTHTDGPLLIVAGAGTGKTTVITQRISWLVKEKNLRTDQILALTFTEKAAAEMEERIDQLLPYGYVDLWVSTFHSFAERILHAHALDIGVSNDFKLLSQTQQWVLVRQNLDRFELDYYRPLGNPTKFIHALLKLFSRAKDEAITPQNYLDYAESLKLNLDSADFVVDGIDEETFGSLSKKEKQELLAQEVAKQQEIANAYHVYQQLLLENNAFDFGDLINYCLQLFQTRPAVLAKYRSQFKYILVDEFQDTNHAQYELVKLLAAPKNNITVVGDDDQSIYKFRGASVSNILEFKKDYPTSTEIFLTQNYRSGQNILDLSYLFIQQNNPDRLEVKLKQEGKDLSKKLLANNQIGGEIKHFHYQTSDDELQKVVAKIIELKNADAEATWNDFAILARTNDTAGQFAHALELNGVPNVFVASRGLYAKSIVLDLIAYLKLLDNYHESSAVYRVLSSSAVGLHHKDLIQLNYAAKRKGYSLYGVLLNPELWTGLSVETKNKIKQFMTMLDKHTAMAKAKPVSEVLLVFLEEAGYTAWLKQADNSEAVESANYLNQFYQRVLDFERSSSDRSVKQFLIFLDFELEAGETGSLKQNLDEGPETVKVMTVHAAKGLEFSYVFIVQMVDRKFPSDNRADPLILPDKLIKEILPQGDAHLQEERRLLYVAMTRAKKGLYFTSAVDYGGARGKKPSKFINELLGVAEDLIATDDQSKTSSDKSTKLQKNEKVKTDWTPELPKYFSYTQLKDFSDCPYHYWLKYILRIPQKGSHYFSFGTSMHSTLQRFCEQIIASQSAVQASLFPDDKPDKKAVVDFEVLTELYQKNWLDDWYEDRHQHDKYYQEGKKSIKDFYNNFIANNPKPTRLEMSFKLPLKGGGNEFYSIMGKIDRIDEVEGGVQIIDYKTGEPKKKLETDDKDQLLLYQLAAEHAGMKVKNLTYYYLKDGSQMSFIGEEKDKEKLRLKLVGLIQKIKAYSFPATPDQCSCRFNDPKEVL
jgi:DNA helicase-2/ATP-dependent DNA helicase PcrA